MVSQFYRFCGVYSFIVSQISWCQRFHVFVGFVVSRFHGFIGFVMSMVSWFHMFLGVMGFIVSQVSWCEGFHSFLVMFTQLVNGKNATGRRAFLQNKFSDKPFSAVGSTLLQTSNFLFYRLLKKYNQISRIGAWSATHDLGGITFCKKGNSLCFQRML